VSTGPRRDRLWGIPYRDRARRIVLLTGDADAKGGRLRSSVRKQRGATDRLLAESPVFADLLVRRPADLPPRFIPPSVLV